MSYKTLTLHECVEGARGWQVGGDGDILFAGALCLDTDRAVGICTVAAHSARGVSDVSQTPITVIPTKKYIDVSQRRQRGACHLKLCINRNYSRIINSAVAGKMTESCWNVLNHKEAIIQLQMQVRYAWMHVRTYVWLMSWSVILDLLWTWVVV